MIAAKVFTRAGVKHGAKLPAFAWPGGYPVIYLCEDGEVFCAACVNGQNGSDVRMQDDPQWNVIAADVFYEGVPEHCAHCNAEIESAYGDPDALDVRPCAICQTAVTPLLWEQVNGVPTERLVCEECASAAIDAGTWDEPEVTP